LTECTLTQEFLGIQVHLQVTRVAAETI